MGSSPFIRTRKSYISGIRNVTFFFFIDDHKPMEYGGYKEMVAVYPLFRCFQMYFLPFRIIYGKAKVKE